MTLALANLIILIIFLKTFLTINQTTLLLATIFSKKLLEQRIILNALNCGNLGQVGLQTAGCQLQVLFSAPSIPENTGKLDLSELLADTVIETTNLLVTFYGFPNIIS
jgi:hypothetical protein